MTIEAGAVISINSEVIFWHLPAGRTAVSIPDTRMLWDVLWDNRKVLAGFAHSHPGYGVPVPSGTDITTFLAIEQALGRRLQWWITSEDRLINCMRFGGTTPRYGSIVVSQEPHWAVQLRRMSRTPSLCNSAMASTPP
jgi:proteasome lid subunit RPN8/RPN11